jgi:hypothetical protein
VPRAPCRSVQTDCSVQTGARQVAHPFGAIVRLLMLTGQRREEVAGMTWAELSEDLATWTIPATRTKNGMPHRRELAALFENDCSVLGGVGEQVLLQSWSVVLCWPCDVPFLRYSPEITKLLFSELAGHVAHIAVRAHVLIVASAVTCDARRCK